MPLLIANFRRMGYDVTRITLSCLAVTGAIAGACYSAVGAHLMSVSVPGFTYYSEYYLVIVAGLLTAYASAVATSGALLNDGSHMRMLVPLACVIAVVEAWIAVVLAFGHSDIDTDFRVAWRRIYLDNSWRLRWMEDRLGCCGFESALDMPSSKACASDLVHGRTDGCLSPLRRHYAHYSEVAVEWTLVILLIQTVALVVGTAIYCRFSNGSTWILEDSDEELIAAEGNTGGGIAEDQAATEATAEATAPQPTAAAQE